MVPVLNKLDISRISRIEILLEVLDIIRPDFHTSERLQVYSRILNSIYASNIPTEDDFCLLDR